MNKQKPYLLIKHYQSKVDVFKEVMAGLEEEGILFQAEKEEKMTDAITLAYQAAKKSALGIGIGISSEEVEVAVCQQIQPHLLPMPGMPIQEKARNAGKYCKRKPLKLSLE